MNLPFTFARRYLVSKKSSNAINIISWISVAGIFVGSLGLILVLSVFNGFEGLVISLYNTFNPDFVIEANEGKSFTPDSSKMAALSSVDGIKAVSSVIEENALLTYGEFQYIATVKGVEDNYGAVSGIDSAMYEGMFLLEHGNEEFAVLGVGIEQSLGVNYEDPYGFLTIYIPRKGTTAVINPEDAFNRGSLKPAGSFAIQSEFDSKYALVSLGFMRRLAGYPTEVTSLEVSIKPGAESSTIQQQIQSIMGSGYSVKNRLQQNETLYRVMKTEKWAVYAILTFILLVAAFNIIGSLTMLVIEKKKDISILKTMGAGESLIRKIFLSEGLLLSLTGCGLGFLIAVVLILGQQQFGWLRIGGGSFVIDTYPVIMKAEDFLLVFFTVMVIGLAAAWFPAVRAAGSSIEIEHT